MTSYLFSPRGPRVEQLSEEPVTGDSVALTVVEATGLPRVADYFALGELRPRGPTLDAKLSRVASSTPRGPKPQSMRTETFRRTDEPHFNKSEEWVMPQDVDPAAVIEFSLFANKLFGAVLVGSTHVLLSTLLEQETSDKWYTLKCKSQDVGSVRVKTSVTRRFKDVPTTQLRDPPPSGSVLQSATRPSPVKIMPPQSSLFSSMRQGQSLAGSLPARDTSQHHSAAASPSRTPGSGVVSRAAATFSYKVGEMVGRGAFGKVFMAMNLVTGELMAVKCVELTDIAKEELEEIQNEVLLEDPAGSYLHVGLSTFIPG